MKTLFVMRHAKAERDSDSGDDFDRALAGRGWRDADRVGREMRERGLDPGLVIASAAIRAKETVEAVARGYGELRTIFDPRFYQASASELLRMVSESDDSADNLMLVGHNPTLQMLILMLAGREGEFAGRVADGLPTSALAVIELPALNWHDVREGSGKLVRLIVPRDLD